MPKLEKEFQHKLILEIKERFPGCIVLKNDPNYIQGFPDLTVLGEGWWALLECKRSAKDPHRPNQDLYIRLATDMSFGAFIFPENKEEILHALEQASGNSGAARISRSV